MSASTAASPRLASIREELRGERGAKATVQDFTKAADYINYSVTVAAYTPPPATGSSYVPSTASEEAALLYLIACSKADSSSIRTQASSSLSLLFARKGCYGQAIQTMEKSLNGSARDPLSWFQLGLLSFVSKKYAPALIALNEAEFLLSQEAHHDPSILPRNLPSLVAAKLCLQYTSHTVEGVRYAQCALKLSSSPAELMTSNFMLGVGNILYARRANTHAERRHHQDDALSFFLAADNIDTPKTATFYFHYGLITAESRQINSAVKLVQKALMLDPNHSGSFNLLALLLSSSKQFEKALRFIKLGLQKDPHHIPMLATMAAIEAVMDPSAAHKTYERLVDLIEVEMFRSKWNLWEGEDSGDLRSSGGPATTTGEGESAAGDDDIMGDDEELDPATEESSNFNDGGHDITFMTCAIQTLCAYAKLCCQMKEFDTAWAYLSKAKSYSHRCPITKMSASVAFHIGLYHEMRNNLDLAESQYLIALAIYDNHVRSLVHLGALFQKQAANTEDRLAKTQCLDKAYGYLLNAIRLDSTSHQAWFHYGSTLQGMGQTEKAAGAFMTSLEWEATAPLKRFEEVAIEL